LQPTISASLRQRRETENIRPRRRGGGSAAHLAARHQKMKLACAPALAAMAGWRNEEKYGCGCVGCVPAESGYLGI